MLVITIVRNPDQLYSRTSKLGRPRKFCSTNYSFRFPIRQQVRFHEYKLFQLTKAADVRAMILTWEQMAENCLNGQEVG
jgi:hypothetical protein